MAKITVEISTEQEKLLKKFGKEKGLEKDTEALKAIVALGFTRYTTLVNYAEKREQLRRFEAGELKTAPTFQLRKNLRPDLAVAPEPKEEPAKAKKAPAKKGKPAESKPPKGKAEKAEAEALLE